MDERVRELLERVRETAVTVGEAAGTTARYAGKCAGQMVDVAKLNMRIFDLNGEINDLLKSIGRMVYDTHRGAEPDAASLAPLLSQIDEKHEAIAQLKQRIRLLKNVRSCPDCGCAAVRRTDAMNYTFEQYRHSADFLRARLGGFSPKIAMILGSGLGYLGDLVEDAAAVPYGDIPHFKTSTAPGHKGRLVFGTLEGQPVAVMQGRMHHYEGYSYEEVAYAVRVLRLLGCDTLIVTNAAGCINTAWKAGELMLISDHIKFFLESPLRGENIPEFGVRFPDASHLYTPALRTLARETAGELGIDLKEGVYMYFPGPQYETPAEIRAGRILGADAAGMSTAPEVIAAGHCGMRVLGFTLLSNMAAGILDQPLTEQEVLDAAEACRDKFSRLVLACLRKID